MPGFLDDPSEFENAQRAFADSLYRKSKLPLFFNPALKAYSRPGETREDFESRCLVLAEEEAKKEFAKQQKKSARDLARFEEKRNRLLGKVEDADHESKARQLETVTSMLESAAGLLFGRRRSIGRAVSGSLSKKRMADKTRRRKDQYESELDELRDRIEDLKDSLIETEDQLTAKYETIAGEIESYPVPPERSDIRSSLVGILWVPVL